MNSVQYEELCRFFLAGTLDIPVEEVRSVDIPNPSRANLPQYKHQIDLYWETGDDISRYLNIANAKWRSSSKIDQPDVMLLQQVKQDVAAHKAVMITNTGFTAGAVAVAKDKGIALHIITPSFDATDLEAKNRRAIQSELLAESSNRGAMYAHEVVHRAFDLTVVRPAGQEGSQKRVVPQRSTRVITGGVNRAVCGLSNRGGVSRGCRRGSGGRPGGRGPGGIQTR